MVFRKYVGDLACSESALGRPISDCILSHARIENPKKNSANITHRTQELKGREIATSHQNHHELLTIVWRSSLSPRIDVL